MKAVKDGIQALVFGEEYKKFMDEGGYDFFDDDGDPLSEGELEECAQEEIKRSEETIFRQD